MEQWSKVPIIYQGSFSFYGTAFNNVLCIVYLSMMLAEKKFQHVSSVS